MNRVNLSRITPLPALVVLVALVRAFTERSEPMTEARIRSLTRDSEREAKGDLTAVVLGLDRRVRERWNDFETFPIRDRQA